MAALPHGARLIIPGYNPNLNRTIYHGTLLHNALYVAAGDYDCLQTRDITVLVYRSTTNNRNGHNWVPPAPPFVDFLQQQEWFESSVGDDVALRPMFTHHVDDDCDLVIYPSFLPLSEWLDTKKLQFIAEKGEINRDNLKEWWKFIEDEYIVIFRPVSKGVVRMIRSGCYHGNLYEGIALVSGANGVGISAKIYNYRDANGQLNCWNTLEALATIMSGIAAKTDNELWNVNYSLTPSSHLPPSVQHYLDNLPSYNQVALPNDNFSNLDIHCSKHPMLLLPYQKERLMERFNDEFRRRNESKIPTEAVVNNLQGQDTDFLKYHSKFKDNTDLLAYFKNYTDDDFGECFHGYRDCYKHIDDARRDEQVRVQAPVLAHARRYPNDPPQPLPQALPLPRTKHALVADFDRYYDFTLTAYQIVVEAIDTCHCSGKGAQRGEVPRLVKLFSLVKII